MIGIGCSSHILHNGASKATSKIDYDFEAFVTTISNYFSGHAQRWDEFSEICAEQKIKIQKIPSFCATRWLSLGNLVNAIYNMWPAIESYFRGAGAEDAQKIIKKVFAEDSFSKSQEYYALVTFFSFILDEFNRINLKTQVKNLYWSKLS